MADIVLNLLFSVPVHPLAGPSGTLWRLSWGTAPNEQLAHICIFERFRTVSKFPLCSDHPVYFESDMTDTVCPFCVAGMRQLIEALPAQQVPYASLIQPMRKAGLIG